MGKVFDALHKAIADKKDEKFDRVDGFETNALNETTTISIDKAKEDNAEPEKPKSFHQSITHPPHSYDKNLVTLNDPSSFAAEQFRMLRTNMLFPKIGIPPKLVLITSAISGEGKSFVAANLAITISQNPDKNVLLIDCDMRRPDVHRLFGYDQMPGLSDYLIKGTPLPSLLLKTPHHRLTILPGGPPPPNPSELLSSNRMAHLLGEVKSRYSDRYIIIDAPPTNLTSEANMISRLVDGIFLVVRCGLTKREIITNMLNHLSKDKVIGIVANDINEDFISYNKGNYTYYKNK